MNDISAMFATDNLEKKIEEQRQQIAELRIEIGRMWGLVNQIRDIAREEAQATYTAEIAELNRLIPVVQGGLQLGIRKGYWTQDEVNEAFKP